MSQKVANAENQAKTLIVISRIFRVIRHEHGLNKLQNQMKADNISFSKCFFKPPSCLYEVPK